MQQFTSMSEAHIWARKNHVRYCSILIQGHVYEVHNGMGYIRIQANDSVDDLRHAHHSCPWGD